MNRLALCVGDKPETGGRILPYEGLPFTVDRHQVALIGGRAFCEACSSVGVIAKTGGQARSWLESSEIALDGDVLLCHCAIPPRVRATRHSRYHEDDLAESQGIAEEIHDEQVRATLHGQPLANYPFRIECADGRILQGLTDQFGALPRIKTGGTQIYTVYWGDEALARENPGDQNA